MALPNSISKNNSSLNNPPNSLNNPLVSIITPTYNHERFIGQCIESVRNQIYQNWEMIIIDDGSTDRTGDIVSIYDDKRIKYIKQDNLGIYELNKTYNKALNISNGDLIAILEGDDLWPANKLKEQVEIFEEHDIVLSWGRMNAINDRGEIIAFGMDSLKHFRQMPQEEFINKLIIDNFIKACTVMIDKKALLKIGGFLQDKDVPFVDYDTFLALSLIGRFYPSDNVMGYWRRHRAQITTANITEMTDAFMVSLNFYNQLDKSLKNSIQFDKKDKLKLYDILLNDAILVSARLNLMRGEWDEAFNKFRVLLIKGNLSIKIQSIIGMVCAFSRRNLEWLAILFCRPKLRDESGEWDSTLYDKNKNLSWLFKLQIYLVNLFLLLVSQPRLKIKP